MRHRRWLLILAVLLLGACTAAPRAEPRTRLSAVVAARGRADAGFARALAPRPFTFPRDHGAHPQYATEWWYYTGNLDTADGRHFGYQLTFFRSGLTPTAPQRASDWATTSLYMAHFALTDVAGQRFYAFERFSRGAAGLAGAEGEPAFRVWLEDWRVAGGAAAGLPMHLRAAQDDLGIDLVLDTTRPLVLQGDHGLSRKGAQPGNASYYYSYTRMETQGSIQIGEQRYMVAGQSWMDHEFGTDMLDARAAGWDWFALQFDNRHDLLFARVRTTGGQGAASATLIAPDGAARPVSVADATFEALGRWRSPRTGVEYPSGWHLRLPGAALDVRLTPYLADQELPLAVIYWEGAVQFEGTFDGQPVRGNAYAELTGYAGAASEYGQVR